MTDALKLAWLFLRRPTAAADACRKPGALRSALIIYALSAVVSLATSYADPLDFANANAPIVAAHGAAFWARVALWEPTLTALSVALGVIAVDWMDGGWLPLKAAVAGLWSAIPALLALGFVSPRLNLGRGALTAALAVWSLPGLALAARAKKDDWREIGAFLLGLDAVQAVGLALTLLAALARSEALLKTVDVAVLIWMLSVSALGLRRLRGLTTSRATFAVLFSLLLATTVPVLAYLLGLASLEVLKVVLYV